ncbi:MAG: hypothetical protein MUQ10_14315 [Anaerolineae bacterium]|nr:hypothetical protein [Anaerolineae bacterium]
MSVPIFQAQTDEGRDLDHYSADGDADGHGQPRWRLNTWTHRYDGEPRRSIGLIITGRRTCSEAVG